MVWRSAEGAIVVKGVSSSQCNGHWLATSYSESWTQNGSAVGHRRETRWRMRSARHEQQYCSPALVSSRSIRSRHDLGRCNFARRVSQKGLAFAPKRAGAIEKRDAENGPAEIDRQIDSVTPIRETEAEQNPHSQAVGLCVQVSGEHCAATSSTPGRHRA